MAYQGSGIGCTPTCPFWVLPRVPPVGSPLWVVWLLAKFRRHLVSTTLPGSFGRTLLGGVYASCVAAQQYDIAGPAALCQGLGREHAQSFDQQELATADLECDRTPAESRHMCLESDKS